MRVAELRCVYVRNHGDISPIYLVTYHTIYLDLEHIHERPNLYLATTFYLRFSS